MRRAGLKPSDLLFPFSSAKKRASILVSHAKGSKGAGKGGGFRFLTKGAAEAILDCCSHALGQDGEATPLSAGDRKRHLAQV